MFCKPCPLRRCFPRGWQSRETPPRDYRIRLGERITQLKHEAWRQATPSSANPDLTNGFRQVTPTNPPYSTIRRRSSVNATASGMRAAFPFWGRPDRPEAPSSPSSRHRFQEHAGGAPIGAQRSQEGGPCLGVALDVPGRQRRVGDQQDARMTPDAAQNLTLDLPSVGADGGGDDDDEIVSASASRSGEASANAGGGCGSGGGISASSGDPDSGSGGVSASSGVRYDGWR